MDFLDFANLRVFGNASFRHKQRSVIRTILQVFSACMCFESCFAAGMLQQSCRRMLLLSPHGCRRLTIGKCLSKGRA